MFRHDGKVVLVTGASRGIGKATALDCASRGAVVWVISRDGAECEKVAEEIRKAGGQAFARACDVTEYAAVERLVREIVDAHGRLDALVNNAGAIEPIAYVWDADPEEWARSITVNLVGVYNGCRAVLPHFKEAGGGVIVNVASVAAIKGIPDRAAYSASKGALVSLTKAMAADYIKDNIRVNCVCPGTTFTEGLAERIKASPDPEAALAEFVRRQPMGRLGKEEEIAHAILFAACDEAAFMTGSIITIDGGASI